MKLLVGLFMLAIFSAPMLSEAQALDSAKLRKIFRKPLVLGASVSAGLCATGPGTVAARGLGASVKNLAKSDATARSTYANLEPATLKQYSVIIAIDLLYWDSTIQDHEKSVPRQQLLAQSLAVLNKLVAAAAEAKVPLVLGDIPNIAGEFSPVGFKWAKWLVGKMGQPLRSQLNSAISGCESAGRCHVVPFTDLLAEASTRGIAINGKTYHFKMEREEEDDDDERECRELVPESERQLTLSPDGLHLNNVGSKYVADIILKILSK